jgi:hypothetical protein
LCNGKTIEPQIRRVPTPPTSTTLELCVRRDGESPQGIGIERIVFA